MAEKQGEDRWHFDPVKGLKTNDKDGRYQSRIAMLEHLKLEYEELGKEGEDEGFCGQIDEALSRLRNGVYDRCTACSKRIPEDIVRQSCPWITTCSHYHKYGEECEYAKS